ncbi:MAG: 3-keto-disaccharide hydrolase [Prolixibacteraceae bacterium]
MNKFKILLAFLAFTLIIHTAAQAQSTVEGSEIIGKWDLTISIEDEQMENLGLFRHGLMSTEGFPGWLEVKLSGFSTLVGRYVGYEGSARPVSEVHYDPQEQKYHFTIPPQWMDIEDIYFEFTLNDDKLTGYKVLDGNKLKFTGVRAPSLTREEPPIWGTPKNLLDENMSGWIIPDNNKFRMVDGVLVNSEVGGNLVSKEKFDDFKLSVEFRYPEGSNSGIYLRGRYELQIEDSKEVSDISIGGIYGFIQPAVDAGAKPGEWQTYEVTLVGRHITVVHNGIATIVNRPIPGITGGSLNSNEGEPGPIMIQGDHGPVEFRKFVITPSVN